MAGTIETIRFNSRQEAFSLKAAASHKAKRLGSGAFATAYLKPGRTPIVVKVGHMGDAYVNYARKVIESKSNNPFLPKLHSLTLYKGNRSVGSDGYCQDEYDFYVVKMERLYDLDDKHKANADVIVDMVEQLVEYNYSIDRWMKNREYTSFCVPGLIEVKSTINKKALLMLKELRQIVMKSLRLGRCGDWDIHDGNIMVRKNGQIVLTDPIA